MTTTYAVTRDAETGLFHMIRAPTAREIEAMRTLDGALLLVAVDVERRTARLLRTIRGTPGDFILWCRRSGHRPISLPDATPTAAALAARPIVNL